MFFDALSKIGAATVSIPIAALSSQTDNIAATIGVGLPATVLPHLERAGFSHAASENLSKALFESSGKTLTGHWMDATGNFRHLYPDNVSVGFHRIHGHHFLTDGLTTLKDPNLSFIDFTRHLATDVVTKNGLPLLPESAVRAIASALSISPTQVMPWVSMNLLDIGGSVLAVGHTATNVTTIVNGSAQWGLGYAGGTFGVGALKMSGGLVTHNPILLGAGAVDVGCGVVTAYDYYSQPFFCGVPVSDLLRASAIGGGIAAALGVLELSLSRTKRSRSEKLALMGERVGSSGVLSAMSLISQPLSLTAGFGLTGFRMARAASESANSYIAVMPISGCLGEEIDEFIFRSYLAPEQQSRIMSYLD